MDATQDSPDDAEFCQKARDFVAQIREYRIRRWGQTRLEQVMDDLVPISIEDVAKLGDTNGKFP